MKELGFDFQAERWEKKDIDPDSFWEGIEREFDDGYSTLEVFLEKGFKYDSVAIGGRIEVRQPEVKINYAFSAAISLTNIIQRKLIVRAADTELIWSWGEFQKAIAVLNEAYSDFKVNEMLREKASERRKDRARQWYALWNEWYILSNHTPKTRVAFNAYFEDFLTELKSAQRIPQKDVNLQDLLILINQLSSPQVKSCVRLPRSFSTDGMGDKAVRQHLENAKLSSYRFPPIGEEFYCRR